MNWFLFSSGRAELVAYANSVDQDEVAHPIRIRHYMYFIKNFTGFDNF